MSLLQSLMLQMSVHHNTIIGYISIRYVSFIYKVQLYPETGTQKSV